MKAVKHLFFLCFIYTSILLPQSGNWVHYTYENTGVSGGMTIFSDSNNDQWIGTDPGFIRHSGNTWTFFNNPAENTSIIEDLSGNIWVAAGYLNMVSGDSVIQYTDSIPMNARSLAVDPDNNIWIGGFGLFKFYNGNFIEYYDSSNSPLIYPSVFNIISDNNGTIWGVNTDTYTQQQLLFSFDGTNWETYTDYVPTFWDKSIAVDKDNNIWFCSADHAGLTNTLIKFDGSTWNQFHIPDSLGIIFFPSAVKIDSQNRVWIGLDGSFLMYDGIEFRKISDEYPGFEDLWITGLAIDENNNKWLSTYDNGIFVYNENGVTEIKTEEGPYYRPSGYNISQNYPNPFNPQTIIEYGIPKASNVEIKIYNSLGEIINTIINKQQSAGEYRIEFDGSSLPSGIYFYRITAGSFVQTKKMILLK